MLILPNAPRILPSVPQYEWREPSIALRKDQFGNQNRTRFRIRAHRDGRTVWQLWFDSRDDADFFFYSLINWSLYDIPVPREDWRLPNEIWGDPELIPGTMFAVDSVNFLTTTSASNQTWTVASDYNSASNAVTVIASGASGGTRGGSTASATSAAATGGSGAGCSQQPNIVLTPGASATYRLPDGGAGVSSPNGVSNFGNSGADAWFNGTTLAGSSVGAKGGLAGESGTSSRTGIAGGAAASGVGATKYSGGASGDVTVAGSSAASGGGGAASPNGDGVASANATNTASDGGAGGPPSGGTGSSGLTSGGTGSDGGSGTEFQVSPARGSGAGSGAVRVADAGSIATSGAAGLYGAGTGGAATRNTTSAAGLARSGDGGQALIVISYALASSGSFLALF